MDGAIKDLDSWKFILKARIFKNVMGVSCTHTNLLEQGNCCFKMAGAIGEKDEADAL